ncbi:hypothetical protein COH55_11685 [Neisseria meningitidis]|nr:hypothetical protein A6J49_12705 [Neisseria meningitidis]RGA59397.1 hypothetical protein CIJ75_11495 [Neisseria meningitidis]RQK73347.1 hypothetical protein COH55_11685 [Neisseria meningitidis]
MTAERFLLLPINAAISNPVIPTKVGIQFFEFQSFPINCLSIECLDSRLRGNDDRTVSVFSGKFLKLKISSFLQKQKTKIRNLKSRHSHESGNPESRTFR